jgi:hypothetical protein
VRGEEHVRRLEVAVHDAARVQRGERRQHAERDRYRLRDGQGAAGKALAEGLPLEQLHGDEQLAVILTDVVELADVGMIDARRRARLAPEAPARRFVAAERRHHLESDHALEPLISRGEHHSHAAFTELALDDVVRNGGGIASRSHLRKGRASEQVAATGLVITSHSSSKTDPCQPLTKQADKQMVSGPLPASTRKPVVNA